MKRPVLKIFPPGDSNLEQGIHFIMRLNKIPEHKISYFGESREEIAEDFKASQPPEGYAFIAVIQKEEICGLFGFDLVEDVPAPSGVVSLWFEVEEVEATFARFKELEARVEYPPTKKPWGAILAALYDPDGNLFGISQRGANPGP